MRTKTCHVNVQEPNDEGPANPYEVWSSWVFQRSGGYFGIEGRPGSLSTSAKKAADLEAPYQHQRRPPRASPRATLAFWLHVFLAEGISTPAASSEPHRAADSSPGNSSGLGKALAHARYLEQGAAGPEDEDEEPGDPEEEEEEEEEEEPDSEAPENGSLPRFVPRFNFTLKDLTRFVDFNIKGRDVIVFLHIQKTGGTTFGRHLVKNIRLEQPCSCKAGQKKCTCHRPGKKETWLFSRFSTGWSCGLHADWTELTNCVPAIMEKKDCPRNHSHTRYRPRPVCFRPPPRPSPCCRPRSAEPSPRWPTLPVPRDGKPLNRAELLNSLFSRPHCFLPPPSPSEVSGAILWCVTYLVPSMVWPPRWMPETPLGWPGVSRVWVTQAYRILAS
ncbi:Heparan-sulfate 6-O-sulfotransferase 3 [Fukomys damarensis]|uniref:Heparan-sulfate 6-O-sulfotransferase n=1 Tax=Fukomys damarensis TaxID=885580 RepID=A0A091E535_FUKDA|nr:Heparan-sulfate 6-O-sulfotransferase 3 [Fukomys damarensis]